MPIIPLGMTSQYLLFAGIVRAGDRVADSVAGILPGSIPRGAAKVGRLCVGSLIAFSVLQKVAGPCMARSTPGSFEMESECHWTRANSYTHSE